MADINPILQAVAANKASESNYQSQMMDAIASNNTIGAQEQTANANLTADEQTVEGTKNSGLLQAQNEIRAVHDMRGGDPSDPSSRMAEMILTHNQYTDQALEVAKGIADKKSTGLLDNPIDWLMNQITLPGDISKYNSLASVANISGAEIDSITADTTNAAVAYKASAATLSAAGNAASLDAIAQRASIASGQLQQATLGHNVDFIKALQGNNEQQLNNAFQLFGAENSNEHLNMQREQLDMLKEQRGWTLDEKMQKADDLQTVANIIHAGMEGENRNAPTLSAAQIKFIRENGSAQEKAKIDRYYDNGLLFLGTKRYNISSDPATAAIIVAQNVNGLPPEMKSVEDAIKAVVSSTRTDIQAKESAGLPVTKEKQQALLATNLKAKADGDAANVELGGDGNIYSPMALDKYLALPTVANTPFAKTVLAEAVKARQTNANVATIWAVADKLEAAGTITNEEKTQGIADFYTNVRNINSGIRDYGRVALPVQSSYNVVVPTSLSWGPKSEIPVDASNITDVKRADSWRKALVNGRLSFLGNSLVKETAGIARTDLDVYNAFIGDANAKAGQGLSDALDANQRQYGDTIIGGAKAAQGKGN